MENKVLASVFEKLGVQKEAQSRLEQIMMFSKDIEIEKALQKISAKVAKGEHGKKLVYGRDEEAYIKYDIEIVKSSKTEELDAFSLEVDNRQYLNVGLLYYIVNKIRVADLSQKVVKIACKKETINFDGNNSASINEYIFKFNRKNVLEEVQHRVTSKTKTKETQNLKKYSKKDIKKIMEKASQAELSL